MRILKLKQTKEHKIHIEYQVPSGGSMDDFSMDSSEQARPEMGKALQALVPHVLNICEFPKSDADKFIVRSFSVSYTSEEKMGIVITSSKVLAGFDAPLIINTPFMLEENMSAGMKKDLGDLFNECELYVRGCRAQQDLFAGVANAGEDFEVVSAGEGGES